MKIRKKQISLRKLRCLFPALTFIVLLSIISSCIYTNVFKDTSLVILTGLMVGSFLLLNIIVQRVISILSVKMTKQKEFELIKNELSNAILLHSNMAKHEENIYKIHHDMKNHLGVIYSMLEDNRKSETLEYAEKIHKAISNS